MKREGGFTLMETLLAITLFAIVMIAVYNVTSLGLHIWKRSRENSVADRKAILALEKMGRELRSALLYAKPDKQRSFSDLGAEAIEYKGSESSVTFPAAIDPLDKVSGGLGGNGRITYQWDSSSHSLCRKVENLSDIYLNAHKKCLPMISDIAKVGFRYWIVSGITKSHSWYDNWDGDDGLPEAIEVNFSVKTQKDLMPKEYRRTFILPAGGEK